MTKRQLNVRISDELWEKIDNSGQTPTECVTIALLSYFDSNTPHDAAIQSNADELQIALQSKADEIRDLKFDNERLLQEIHFKDELLHRRDEHVKDLRDQLGFMQLEFGKLDQALLLPAKVTPVRKWYEIWK